MAFPWAFGTWVLMVRRRPDLIERASEGWSLLLDPSLKDRLVLPSSPRVVISLLAGPGSRTEPDLPERLRRLRSQALAFDDIGGLNLLLAAEAAPGPAPLVAVTVKVYDTPLVRPVRVAVVAAPS
jgi:hypothetical protein